MTEIGCLDCRAVTSGRCARHSSQTYVAGEVYGRPMTTPPADPDPNCPRCKGTGEEPNAQFRCACRWRHSRIPRQVTNIYDAIDGAGTPADPVPEAERLAWAEKRMAWYAEQIDQHLEAIRAQAEQIATLQAALTDWQGRAQRQYDENVAQIAEIATLQAEVARQHESAVYALSVAERALQTATQEGYDRAVRDEQLVKESGSLATMLQTARAEALEDAADVWERLPEDMRFAEWLRARAAAARQETPHE